MRPIIIVSPHPDDAALCLGGWLWLLKCRRAKFLASMRIITVFTRSRYAPYRRDIKTADEISALRLSEEMSFCDKIGVRWTDLRLEDSSMLASRVSNGLGGAADPRRSALVSALSAAVPEDAIVFGPLGIGGHPDHHL